MIRIALFATLLMMAFGTSANDDQPLPRFIVHLETGPAWDPELPPAEQNSFAAHSANMKRLRDSGRILFGARYADYGLLIIEDASLEAVEATLSSDPGVKAGIFRFRIEAISIFYPWRNANGTGR